MRSLSPAAFGVAAFASLTLAGIFLAAGAESFFDADMFYGLAVVALLQMVPSIAAWLIARAGRSDAAMKLGAVAVFGGFALGLGFSPWFALPAVFLAIGLAQIRMARRQELLEEQGIDASELPDWHT